MITQNHPWGDTVATETLWDDSFIEEAITSENLTDAEFDALPERDQQKILRNYSRILTLESI